VSYTWCGTVCDTRRRSAGVRSPASCERSTPPTRFEGAKVRDNFVVSLFTRVQANDYSVVKERLPEVRFDGLPVEIGGGFYHRINVGFAALKDDNPITGVTTRSMASIAELTS